MEIRIVLGRKVRLASAGWENFTGTFGFQATFTDGVSDNELNARQIARIGSSVKIVDVETGEQVGPAQMAVLLQVQPIASPEQPKTLDVVKRDEAREKAALIEAEAKRKAEEKIALTEAQRKADEAKAEDEIVIYTRGELEAIAANNGIHGLREIATPLEVKGRGIQELVNEILKAQSKRALV